MLTLACELNSFYIIHQRTLVSWCRAWFPTPLRKICPVLHQHDEGSQEYLGFWGTFVGTCSGAYHAWHDMVPGNVMVKENPHLPPNPRDIHLNNWATAWGQSPVICGPGSCAESFYNLSLRDLNPAHCAAVAGRFPGLLPLTGEGISTAHKFSLWHY